MQTDYDYEILKQEREKQKMEQKQEFEVVSDIPKENIQEVVNEDVHKKTPSSTAAQIQNDDNILSQSRNDYIDDTKDSSSQAYIDNSIQQNEEKVEIYDIRKYGRVSLIFLKRKG